MWYACINLHFITLVKQFKCVYVVHLAEEPLLLCQQGKWLAFSMRCLIIIFMSVNSQMQNQY